ncbi:hypothetical protein O181_023505 [Austropuccinia psidii MF-1]|uniref:Uncharacterized protein n=1 Tax=Austropuccinia psidii MF-1 TaxID=1389203 RepID=A0A9Q3GZ55_9BASI|nr:hypothetical protein [Austropuccinia psidii MF-1]
MPYTLYSLQAVIHRPWSVEPLGPFWPKYNEEKRGQGGQPPTFKARWDPNHKLAHLSQIWPLSHQYPEWPKGPQHPNWPLSTPGLWQSPEATKSSSASFPLVTGALLSEEGLALTYGGLRIG